MAMPEHEPEKEAKRHKPALGGIAIALGFAGLLVLGYVVYIAVSGSAPEGADTQINGITGEEVENE